MIKTRITEMFGVEYPIIQGGLMWIAKAELVSAVANAGAMGFLTALTHPTPELFAKEVRKTREMTDKPFGVNITILPSLKPIPYEAYVDALIAEGIKFVETAGNNPEPFMPKFKAAGIKVIHKCTSVRHSIKAEKLGVDAISIDGFECAGHPGEDDVTTLILVPLTADAVKIPIVASGGFGDGRGLVAALALGAEGMNMGTRFMATKEAPIHEGVKQALVKATERDTALLMRTLRNTSRVLANGVAKKVLEVEARGNATIEDIKHLVSGAEGKKMYDDGNIESGVVSAGQIVGLIHDIPTCQELMLRIVSEAREIMASRLPGMLERELV